MTQEAIANDPVNNDIIDLNEIKGISDEVLRQMEQEARDQQDALEDSEESYYAPEEEKEGEQPQEPSGQDTQERDPQIEEDDEKAKEGILKEEPQEEKEDALTEDSQQEEVANIDFSDSIEDLDLSDVQYSYQGMQRERERLLSEIKNIKEKNLDGFINDFGLAYPEDSVQSYSDLTRFKTSQIQQRESALNDIAGRIAKAEYDVLDRMEKNLNSNIQNIYEKVDASGVSKEKFQDELFKLTRASDIVKKHNLDGRDFYYTENMEGLRVLSQTALRIASASSKGSLSERSGLKKQQIRQVTNEGGTSGESPDYVGQTREERNLIKLLDTTSKRISSLGY